MKWKKLSNRRYLSSIQIHRIWSSAHHTKNNAASTFKPTCLESKTQNKAWVKTTPNQRGDFNQTEESNKFRCKNNFKKTMSHCKLLIPYLQAFKMVLKPTFKKFKKFQKTNGNSLFCTKKQHLEAEQEFIIRGL